MLINSLVKLTVEPVSESRVGFTIVIRLSSDYYQSVKIKGKTLEICENFFVILRR